MSLWKEQAQFAEHVAMLIDYIFHNGYYCTFGEAFRTVEQAALYAQQGKGIKNSLHCKRLAIDLNLITKDGKYLIDSKDYEIFGKFWESLDPHNRWGGKFSRPDGNHFERQESIVH